MPGLLFDIVFVSLLSVIMAFWFLFSQLIFNGIPFPQMQQQKRKTQNYTPLRVVFGNSLQRHYNLFYFQFHFVCFGLACIFFYFFFFWEPNVKKYHRNKQKKKENFFPLLLQAIERRNLKTQMKSKSKTKTNIKWVDLYKYIVLLLLIKL